MFIFRNNGVYSLRCCLLQTELMKAEYEIVHAEQKKMEEKYKHQTIIIASNLHRSEHPSAADDSIETVLEHFHNEPTSSIHLSIS